MAVIKLSDWESSFESDYRAYLASRETAINERYRDDEETIFDALASPEADFTKGEEGQQILAVIQNLK